MATDSDITIRLLTHAGRNAPILARREFPKGHDGYRVPTVLLVEGGLAHHTGNSLPYFSLTCTTHRKGFPSQVYSGGADHASILRYFPHKHFDDLASLHLSDINGEPMHTVANAWYWLAGAVSSRGAFGEDYHHTHTEEECLSFFANHLRISMAEARSIRFRVYRRYLDTNQYNGARFARSYLATLIDAMRPRWQAEARACIARHSLQVFGDQWPA